MTNKQYEAACEALKLLQESLNDFYGVDDELTAYQKQGELRYAQAVHKLLLSAWPGLNEGGDNESDVKT